MSASFCSAVYTVDQGWGGWGCVTVDEDLPFGFASVSPLPGYGMGLRDPFVSLGPYVVIPEPPVQEQLLLYSSL